MVNRQPVTIDTAKFPSYNGTTAAQHPPGCVANAIAKLRGRATKMCDDIVVALLDDLKSGVTMTRACKNAGISVSTFNLWREINPDFSAAVASTREDWTAALVDRGLTNLEDVEAETSADSSKVRKAEVIARHTLEIASRLNPAYSAKSQSMNLNVNTTIDPVDLAKFTG